MTVYKMKVYGVIKLFGEDFSGVYSIVDLVVVIIFNIKGSRNE